MKTIILASRNPHKIEELHALLTPYGVELHSALDYPDLQEVVEDGQTLEANALKKARYVARATGLPALADDTGLEVDALAGRPGVYSARYAGDQATYAQNVEKLLGELREVTVDSKRTARFRTVVAFVTGEEERVFQGCCEGQIVKTVRGEGGFGYDPVFLPQGFRRTFAELSAEEKNGISHRGRAIGKFLDWLAQQ